MDNRQRQFPFSGEKGRQLRRRWVLEFRCYNSSLHAGVVKAYIQFSLAISAQAVNQKFSSSKPIQISRRYGAYLIVTLGTRLSRFSHILGSPEKVLAVPTVISQEVTVCALISQRLLKRPCIVRVTMRDWPTGLNHMWVQVEVQFSKRSPFEHSCGIHVITYRIQSGVIGYQIHSISTPNVLF